MLKLIMCIWYVYLSDLSAVCWGEWSTVHLYFCLYYFMINSYSAVFEVTTQSQMSRFSRFLLILDIKKYKLTDAKIA